MSVELWEIIANINACLNSLREADSQASIATFDLVELRTKLRAQLDYLRKTVTELHSERDAYFALFPLVAHCDELVKKMILGVNHLEWPSLQQELYQVADAGDLFYEMLDNALGKSDTLPLIYEVYYFCLIDGFSGRHGANAERASEYLKALRSHIKLQEIKTADDLSPAKKHKTWLNLRTLNRFYYAGTFVLLVMLYLLLSSIAASWQPSTL
jgi:type IV/VI secretion system ImpK/VasF family protein